MRAVVFVDAGGNEVVHLETRADPTPAGAELLVAVRYAGLNPADVAQRGGHYPAPPGAPPDIPGLEVAGTIVARGQTALRFEVGQRVFGIVGGGGLADRVLVDERHVVAVPDRLDASAAAAVPEVFVTAHDALFTQAGLGAGELLVVNGANGGVGTAAVQLGAARGARVVATVRAAELRSAISDLGSLSISPEDLVECVTMDGAGADVILELVGAANVDKNLEALASKGRIVIVAAGESTVTIELRQVMRKRARLIGTILRGRQADEKRRAVEAFERDVVPLLADGVVAPLVDSIFPARDVTAAFDRLEASGKLGKVLLDFGADV